MFRTLKQRIKDIRTIKSMCLGAERHANVDGEKEPGLEHFILAALDLPDGTARKAFERIGADPDLFRGAIAEQYDGALRSIGVETSHLGSIHRSGAPIPPNEGIYKSKPQVQALMQQLATRDKKYASEPLLGAHVIAAVATFQHGVASRTLAMMEIDRKALIEAAQLEVETARDN